jgi:rhodanese-related sulfurtransferase
MFELSSYDPKVIAAEVRDDKAIIVDVREDYEWESGHARGAVHMPLGEIMAGELPTKSKKKKIYLYCVSGSRSGMATQFLLDKGYDAVNLGGLSTWQSAGGKVLRD